MAFYGVGMFLAVMMGIAVGKPLAEQHGRRAVVIAVVCTLVAGLSIGWALNTWWAMIEVLGQYHPAT